MGVQPRDLTVHAYDRMIDWFWDNYGAIMGQLDDQSDTLSDEQLRLYAAMSASHLVAMTIEALTGKRPAVGLRDRTVKPWSRKVSTALIPVNIITAAYLGMRYLERANDRMQLRRDLERFVYPRPVN